MKKAESGALITRPATHSPILEILGRQIRGTVRAPSEMLTLAQVKSFGSEPTK
jgi:hypothetical protein